MRPLHQRLSERRTCPILSRDRIPGNTGKPRAAAARMGGRTAGSTSWAAAAERRRSTLRDRRAVRDCPPRKVADASVLASKGIFHLSGLEPLNITPEMGFVIVGERTNITGSPKFSKLILGGDFEAALAVARQQVKGGANILDVNMDEGMIDSEASMTRFLNLIGSEPEISRIPIMIDSSKWSVTRGRAEVRSGKRRW